MPATISRLTKLEFLSCASNAVATVDPSISQLAALRVLKLGRNKLATTEAGLPRSVLRLEDLCILDVDRNGLEELPEGWSEARELQVLSLASNQLKTLPSALFTRCIDLKRVDLSGNSLTLLPPQLRRLENLVSLNLADNPLVPNTLRCLLQLTHLQLLNLRNTGRTTDSIPAELGTALVNLTELDLSQNNLDAIPATLDNLRSLRRLNLSGNAIGSIETHQLAGWGNLRTLNLSRNRITQLMPDLHSLENLRALYVNSNNLTSLPDSMARLSTLVRPLT